MNTYIPLLADHIKAQTIFVCFSTHGSFLFLFHLLANCFWLTKCPPFRDMLRQRTLFLVDLLFPRWHAYIVHFLHDDLFTPIPHLMLDFVTFCRKLVKSDFQFKCFVWKGALDHDFLGFQKISRILTAKVIQLTPSEVRFTWIWAPPDFSSAIVLRVLTH